MQFIQFQRVRYELVFFHIFRYRLYNLRFFFRNNNLLNRWLKWNCLLYWYKSHRLEWILLIKKLHRIRVEPNLSWRDIWLIWRIHWSCLGCPWPLFRRLFPIQANWGLCKRDLLFDRIWSSRWKQHSCKYWWRDGRLGQKYRNESYL